MIEKHGGACGTAMPASTLVTTFREPDGLECEGATVNAITPVTIVITRAAMPVSIGHSCIARDPDLRTLLLDALVQKREPVLVGYGGWKIEDYHF